MLSSFFGQTGSRLTDRWAGASAGAIVFWTGGLAAWVYHGGFAVLRAEDRSFDRLNAPAQTAIVVAALLAIAISAIVVDRLSPPAIRFLQGYWPAFMSPVRRHLAGRVGARAAAVRQRFRDLAEPVAEGTATGEQNSEYVRLDRELHWLPSDGSYQPTAIGNILRAAECRPQEKYGLETTIVWPRLWLLLPESARAELTASRRSLDGATVTCLWGVLFVLFTPLAWWAAVIGIAVAAAVYRFWLPWRAVAFADLLDAAFDLYRTLLYQQLRWPFPVSPKAERAIGAQLSVYLWRGLPGDEPAFTSPPSEKEGTGG